MARTCRRGYAQVSAMPFDVATLRFLQRRRHDAALMFDAEFTHSICLYGTLLPPTLCCCAAAILPLALRCLLPLLPLRHIAGMMLMLLRAMRQRCSATPCCYAINTCHCRDIAAFSRYMPALRCHAGLRHAYATLITMMILAPCYAAAADATLPSYFHAAMLRWLFTRRLRYAL